MDILRLKKLAGINEGVWPWIDANGKENPEWMEFFKANHPLNKDYNTQQSKDYRQKQNLGQASQKLQSIAEEVYRLAESRAADQAADQQGHGFDRNAVMKEADTIWIEIKAHLEFKLKNHKF